MRIVPERQGELAIEQGGDLRQHALEIAFQSSDAAYQGSPFRIVGSESCAQSDDLRAGTPERDQLRAIETQAGQMNSAGLGQGDQPPIGLLAQM